MLVPVLLLTVRTNTNDNPMQNLYLYSKNPFRLFSVDIPLRVALLKKERSTKENFTKSF
jgi:hypothetical protein